MVTSAGRPVSTAHSITISWHSGSHDRDREHSNTGEARLEVTYCYETGEVSACGKRLSAQVLQNGQYGTNTADDIDTEAGERTAISRPPGGCRDAESFTQSHH